MAASCVFCKIVSGEAPADIYYQDDEIMIFKDIKPVSNFHFQVIPKEHISSVNCLTNNHVKLVSKLVAKGKEVLVENGGELDDVRLGFHVPPFNSVSHLHLHVISPESQMSLLNKIIFNNAWFASVDYILAKIGKSKM